jgi:hypothetical protein
MRWNKFPTDEFNTKREMMTHHIAIVSSNIARFHDAYNNKIWRPNSLNFLFYFVCLLIVQKSKSWYYVSRLSSFMWRTSEGRDISCGETQSKSEYAP